MEFRILGSFEIVGSVGLVELRGAKRRGLLACLVVHAGQPLSTDRLVEELWVEGGSDGAARTVQTYVSQLRKLLHGEPATLETHPGGYTLEVDPADIDAYRFEQGLVSAGAEGDPWRRLAILDPALELWRGSPLAEFAGASWADGEATRLEALHLQALRRRYDALLELDRATDAVAELEVLVSAHPLDETFCRQFMLALYRSGRQADALAAYQQVRRHLIDELGIEPGPELTELEHRILVQDPTLASPNLQAMAGARPAVAGQATSWYPRTFLLTDIVDSVSLWERDAPAMSHAVAQHDALIRDAVRASGGELVRTKGEGDSTFSVFAHPSDALAAATAIREAISIKQLPAPIRLRAGVHTGDAEPRDGDWYGQAVNRAARLRSLADGDQALLSGVTAGLVADQLPQGIRLLYRGRRALRGIERPEEVWELVATDDPRLVNPISSDVGRVPVALTSFVGRVEDLDQLTRLVHEERLVTLIGPGGSGKTRLATELVRQAADRGEVVWLAELAPLRDGELILQAVAAAIGIETGPDPLNDLLAQPDVLCGLLVIDNCEHLLEAATALIGRMVAAAPELRVLATSRESLGLAGEREWALRPLDVPDESLRDRDRLVQVESVKLLIDRGRGVRADIAVRDDDVASIVQICRMLDGMPLAIELAAGRLRSFSFADLAARLDDQPRVLANYRAGGRSDDARHQTLRMTLDWSYNQLTGNQQTLAKQLSVFAGGFRLDAVEAVCDHNLDVLDGIDELVAKSLVTFDPVTARYRLLEPIRQYLARHLDETGATDSTQRAHAQWVANLSKLLGTRLLEDQEVRSNRLREERGNIEAALLWAHARDEAEIACEIVGALGQFWFFNDQVSSRRWGEIIVGLSDRVAPHLRARVLLATGMAAQNDWAWDRSLDLLREALAIYEAKQSMRGQATALYWLGRGLASRWDEQRMDEDAAEAGTCLERGRQLFVEQGEPIGSAWCRIWLSSIALWEGNLSHAEAVAQQVVDECTAANVEHPISQALCHLAFIAHRQGRDERALQLMHEAAEFCRQRDDRWQLLGVLADLAAQEVISGRGTHALQALAESARLDIEIGRLPVRARWLAVAAVVHMARGDVDLATATLGAYNAYETNAFKQTPGGGIGEGYIGWVTDAVIATRERLDPIAVRAATAAARPKTIDQLIADLIVEPASRASLS